MTIQIITGPQAWLVSGAVVALFTAVCIFCAVIDGARRERAFQAYHAAKKSPSPEGASSPCK